MRRRASEIVFQIETDPMDGGFLASALGAGITTQAETAEELRTRVREALLCHFDRPEDIPPVIRLHFVHDEVIALVP